MPGDFDGVVAAVTGGGSGTALAVDAACRGPAPANRRDERARAPGDLPLGWSGPGSAGWGSARHRSATCSPRCRSPTPTPLSTPPWGPESPSWTPLHYGLGVAERRPPVGWPRCPGPVRAVDQGRPAGPLARGGRDGRPEGFVVPRRPSGSGTSPATGCSGRWRRAWSGSAWIGRRGLVHDPDNHEREAAEQAFPALVELRDQGVVQAIGAGMNQAEMLTRFVRELDLDLVLMAGHQPPRPGGTGRAAAGLRGARVR